MRIALLRPTLLPGGGREACGVRAAGARHFSRRCRSNLAGAGRVTCYLATDLTMPVLPHDRETLAGVFSLGTHDCWVISLRSAARRRAWRRFSGAGLPVPDGFCITTAACQHHLASIPRWVERRTALTRLLSAPHAPGLLGEILVAPATDPGWAPLLLTAAGVLVALGGHLSHGSVIARGYGLPAVVNVRFATRLIRTAQRLEVDADRGVMRLLD